MTREKAIEAMDLLVSQGYHVQLQAHNLGDHRLPNRPDEPYDYGVVVNELSFDRVDLKHLVEQAEKLDLDLYCGGFQAGVVAFQEPREVHPVVAGPRRHPR